MYRLLRIAARNPNVYEYRISARAPDTRPKQLDVKPTHSRGGNGWLMGGLSILGAHTAYVCYATYNYLQSQSSLQTPSSQPTCYDTKFNDS